MALPNVVGTALGQKRCQTKLTGDRSIVVIVDQKLSKSEIPKSKRVPTAISDEDKTVLTDVIAIPSLRRQVSSPPYYSFDGGQQGTVTAFARQNDKIYAVSCAHCLEGSDADPYTADPISLYCKDTSSYVEVGMSVYGFKGAGHGTPGDFGFADVGLFSVLKDEFMDKAKNGSMLKVRNQLRVNDKVFAQSAHGGLMGTIDMVEGVFANLYADFVVSLDGDGTFGGDSGMLWRSSSNAGVGIHTYGSIEPPGVGSRYSVSMFARRARDYLQVDFIDPV